MYDELSGQVELAPDLEWLLLNDQSKKDDLLVQLVEEYGADISLLMQAVFAESLLAQKALVESLAQIIQQSPSYRTHQPVRLWIYTQALDAAWMMRRKWYGFGTGKQDTEQNIPALHVEQNILPDWISYLPEQLRAAIVLKRYLGLEQAEIEKILHITDNQLASDLSVVNKTFPSDVSGRGLKIAPSDRQRLVELAQRRLIRLQPKRHMRRTILEMSWAVGAIVLVAFLTGIYDLRNPDPVRQAVDIPFLTPLPASKQNTRPTPTPIRQLNMLSTSEEIALRYFQRSLNFDTIWENALVILGGGQGGPSGYSVKRVEVAWDTQSREMMILTGSPGGSPENGLFSDGLHYYELTIRNGSLAEVSAMDLSQPRTWYYLAMLPYNLQINNYQGNWVYKPVGRERMAGRDALVVEVINSEGIIELTSWLDTYTAIPLRQLRFGEQGEQTTLVLDLIVDQIEIDKPFPENFFSLEISRKIEFREGQESWWMEPELVASLRRMEQDYLAREDNDSQSNNSEPLYYLVKEISNQEGIKYSTSVFAGRMYIGEYPMGNPWSVQCERSPDGNRVAFIEDRRFEFGRIIPSKVLHWFPINPPFELYTPLPGVDATRFTFSPDSSTLAIHASSEVSLLDLDSGKATLLLEVPAVDRLVFSDDGKYLGILRGPTHPSGSTFIWILDLKNKLVVEELRLGPEQDWDSQRKEIFATRQVDFTETIYHGLDNCR